MLLPFYFDIFREMKIQPLLVIMLRKDVDVYKSLNLIHGFSLKKALDLYDKYMESIEKTTKNRKRVFIAFEELLDNTDNTINKIKQTLDLPIKKSLKKEKQISAFLDKRLKHHNLNYETYLREFAEDHSKLKEKLEEEREEINILKGELEDIKESISYIVDRVSFGSEMIKRKGGFKLKRSYKEPETQKDFNVNFNVDPKISIVIPVYNIKREWLEACIDSVLRQRYKNWELCIVDDASTQKQTKKVLKSLMKRKDERIKIKFLRKNKGIAGATNEAVRLSTGEFVGFLDSDDEISKDALFEVVEAINEKECDVIYSDEDKLTLKGKRTEAFYKPSYSPDRLLSQNYMCHFLVVKRSIGESVGWLRDGFSGSQDYDFILRCVEKTDKIYRIPKILYHWRKVPGSTAVNVNNKPEAWENGRRAIEDSLKRRNIKGKVLLGKGPCTYQIVRQIEGNPLVSIVIPFRDAPKLLRKCMNSILEKSTYQNFEIVGVNHRSQRKETLELIEYYKKKDNRIRFYNADLSWNFSMLSNYGVKKAKGEHVVLLNVDTEVTRPDWIERLLEHSQRKEVGAVGAKLYYPNGKIQHAGVIIGTEEVAVAWHIHRFTDGNNWGYFGSLIITQNLSAVTAACMMVKKKLYEEIGGLDEKNLAVAFNDIDFCLRLREKGYLNIFTPHCEVMHHESALRSYKNTPEEEKRVTSTREEEYMKKRHKNILKKGDPYYNPNLILNAENFARDKMLDQHIAAKDQHINNLNKVIAAKDQHIDNLNKVIAAKDQHIANLDVFTRNLTREIVNIKKYSVFYNLLSRFRRELLMWFGKIRK